MSTIIKVRCTDQVLTFENTPVIASGGLEEDFVSFAFCSKWDGLVKTAVFWRSEEEVYHVLLDEADSCPIPREVLAVEGVIYFGVFGVNEAGKQRTSEVLRYNIAKGAITEGTKPTDPTPDIYTQILGEFLRYENEINATLDDFARSWAEYQAAMTQAQTDHEEAVARRQQEYEEALTKRQEDYETGMTQTWEQFKTGGDFVLKVDYEKDQEEQEQEMEELQQQVDEVEKTVNDQLDPLALSPAGTGTLYVYCKDEAGEPVSGCVVQIGEELAVTGASGAVKYFLAPGTYSVTIVSPIDYGAEAQTKSVAVALSEAVSIEAAIQDSLNGATEVDFTSSVTAAFSDRVASADVFGVGGGGSGGVSAAHGTNLVAAAATGGAGGKTATVKNIDLKKVFVLSVGSGGVAKTTTSVTAVNGASGGTTTVSTSEGTVLLSAAGGAGGNAATKSTSSSANADATGAAGGSGSGAAYAYNTVTAGFGVSDSGEDGASGGSLTYSTTTVKGGTGQGTTTRAFGDADGELFASAGGSAAQAGWVDLYTVLGMPGEGGGAPACMATDSNYSGTTITVSAEVGKTHGSGGGAAVATSAKSNITRTVTSGAGKSGLIRFRWEVA